MNHSYEFYHTTGDNVVISFNKGPTLKITATSVDALDTGVWTHLAATYSGNGQEEGLNIYKDGVLLSTEQTQGSAGDIQGQYFAPGQDLYLGSRVGGTGWPLRNATLDELRFYSKELSASEITDIINLSP